MGEAVLWGAVAASSLIIGAGLGLARSWPRVQLGLVLAFGAGALISAVSFELWEEGLRIGGAGWVALGLGLGALSYFFASRALDSDDGHHRPPSGSGSGNALALGATLDGIPEQLVLGIGIAAGDGVSASLLVAIFISNLPEAIGSASEMKASGHSNGRIRAIWIVVAVLGVLATIGGFALADVTGGNFTAVINGFAAGALLVMLVDSMIPEARAQAGTLAGLVSVLGFAVAAGLSSLG